VFEGRAAAVARPGFGVVRGNRTRLNVGSHL
jgi:hypothetical protein